MPVAVELVADFVLMQQVSQVDQYLGSRWGGARAEVVSCLRSSVGGAPQGVGSSAPLRALLAGPGLGGVIARAAGLGGGVPAAFVHADQLHRGLNPFCPARDASGYARFLLWSWSRNGSPSFRWVNDAAGVGTQAA